MFRFVVVQVIVMYMLVLEPLLICIKSDLNTLIHLSDTSLTFGSRGLHSIHYEQFQTHKGSSNEAKPII